MRLFIATTFPEEATRELNECVASIRTKLPPASWVRPESQHLTFAFLGEQDEEFLTAIDAPLKKIASAQRAFKGRLRGCGFFPNERRARVGWIGLEPPEPFVDVARTVQKVVTAAGVDLDRAEFRPHLTLMRIREQWPPASIGLFKEVCGKYESAEFGVDKITLYSSRLNPKGAIHTPMRDFYLA